MGEYHFPVPGAENEKEILVFVRRHWASYFGQFLLSFVVLIVPIVVFIIIFTSGINERIFHGLILNILVLILSAYYLVALTFTFTSWISFYYCVYIITKLEIIEITQVGFFGRKISQLSLLRIQDVTSDIKGFLATFFGYGNVLIETASEQKESFLLQNVPNPQEISSKIMNLHDEVIGREGRRGQVLEGEGTFEPRETEPSKNVEDVTKMQEESHEKTTYQQLLEKDKGIGEHNQEKNNLQEGEVSQDDLTRGGEINLKE